MERAGSRPPEHDEYESAPCAHHIEHAAADRVEQSVWNEKSKLQPGELLIAERDCFLYRRDGHRKGLPVEVTNGNRNRDQGDEKPPHPDWVDRGDGGGPRCALVFHDRTHHEFTISTS